MWLPIFTDIFKLEVLRLDEVKLNRRTLPLATQRVMHHKVHFGTIESSFADADFILEPPALDRVAQRCFRVPPDLVTANVLLPLLRIVQGEAQIIIHQAVRLEDLQREIDRLIKLLL